MKSYSLFCRLFNFNDCHFHFPSISSQFQISRLKTFKFSCSRLVSSCLCSWDSIFCPRWSEVRPNELSNLIGCGQDCISAEVWDVLLLFHCDSICCSWSRQCVFSHNAPHQPTELAQTAWHPATDYLCGRQRVRCARAGEATEVCSWSKIPTLTCGCIIFHLPVGLLRLLAFFFLSFLFFCYTGFFFSPENVLFHHSSVWLRTYNERWIMSYKYPHRRSSVRVLTAPAGPVLVPGVLAG